jgi:hypothetical protein
LPPPELLNDKLTKAQDRLERFLEVLETFADEVSALLEEEREDPSDELLRSFLASAYADNREVQQRIKKAIITLRRGAKVATASALSISKD